MTGIWPPILTDSRSEGAEKWGLAAAGPARPRVRHLPVAFDAPGIGRFLKNAGCDVVLPDMEHSGIPVDAEPGVRS